MALSVLITGCSGFIGSRLAIRCARAGMEVIASSRQTSPSLEKYLGMPVLSLDVLKPILLTQDIQSDIILHTSTANDTVSRDFCAGVSLSVCGTRNVLELAVQRGIRRVVFFSTLQVYGTELGGEIIEDTPTRCETPYALNHLLGEELCRMYARTYGIDIVLMRPANVYGVPDATTVNRTSLVPMCFVKEALDTGKLTLRSSGRQKRNFVSTDEVADACLHLLGNFPTGCQVVNVGSHLQPSIHEIAEMTAQVYLQHTGHILRVEVLSDIPEQSNEFVLRSRLDSLRPTAEESSGRMTQVIRDLFNYFQ